MNETKADLMKLPKEELAELVLEARFTAGYQAGRADTTQNFLDIVMEDRAKAVDFCSKFAVCLSIIAGICDSDAFDQAMLDEQISRVKPYLEAYTDRVFKLR